MPFGQATRDACRCRALSGRDDDAHAVVATASHRATARVHHEADQEPARSAGANLEEEYSQTGRKPDRSHSTDTSEEDDSHAVITVHPNKGRERQKFKKKNNRESKG